MTTELSTLFAVALAYLATLFLVAYATERGWLPAGLARHPATQALSLGVYATTWTYYGSVGFAASQGFLFLTIYLGVTLAMFLWPVLLAPILRLSRECQLQSLADLFEFRFTSRYTGLLVTVFMLLGVLPYLSLQIRAVTASVEVLTQGAAPTGSPLLAATFCLLATLFAVLFGARQSKPREHHEGLLVAIAFESLVKLVALLAVGALALFGVFGGGVGLQRWLAAHPQALAHMYAPVGGSAWTTLLLLSFSAAFLLPRQFHMLFTENRGSDLRTAAWLFPLLLLLLNLPIPVLLWAGQAAHLALPPDYYLLGLTTEQGQRWLQLLAFIGGISAASAMVIVESLALASMCLNHLVLPLWLRRTRRAERDLYLQLRRWRRALIAAVIATGYVAYLVMRQNQGLAQMGLISFVAVAQFLPGMVALLTWPRATRVGFIAGICGGMAVWFVTLAWPLLASGEPGLGLTVPAQAARWPFLTFWSLAINGALLVAGSLLTRPRPREILADQAIRHDAALLRERGRTLSPAQMEQRLASALGAGNARRELLRALADCGLPQGESRPHALLRLEARLEHNLSGLLGPHLARRVLGPRTPAGRLLEDQLEREGGRLTGLAAELDHLRRLHRRMLHELPIGACSIAGDGSVRLWNQRLTTLSGLSEDGVLGRRVEDLPPPWADLLASFLSVADTHLYRVELALTGGRRWLNLHKEAIGFEPGDAGSVVLLEDLTEQRLLEAELAHSERLASIGSFAAGVAHEIGNPLTGISSLAQNLKLDAHSPDLRAGIDEILQQSRRIQQIVGTLLTFSHGGERPAPTPQRFALADCVAEAVRLARLAGAGNRLHFAVDVPAEVEIVAERPRLLQVLVNLLTNAADASPPGATVEIQARRDGDGVRLTVTDHGCGIPETLRERVFEPFFTTKAPGRGTGLGLPLVYRIVRDHGGDVWLDSTPGRGTRVSLRLPLNPPAVNEPSPASTVYSPLS